MSYRYTLTVILSLALLITGCKAPQQAITGQTAYDLKEYSTAGDLLQKDFNSEKDPVKKQEKAYEIAESYRKYNNTTAAAEWYKKAADLGSEEAPFKLGLMQMMNEQYDEATKTFTKYGEADAMSRIRAQRELKNIQNAQQWKQAITKTQVTNLAYINTPQSDFCPVLYKGRLVFSSSRSDATGDMNNAWTGEKSADIFISDLSAGAKAEKFSTVIDSKDYEGTCSFSKDGNEIYFTRCGVLDNDDKKNKPTANAFCHLYYSRLSGGSWSEPESLKLFADTVNVGHPALSKDGKILFVSSDLKAGFGGKDLYYFTKTDSGWAGPNNAGTNINSGGDEMFPWLDDRNNLYYASDGLPGMGGLDIFKAVKGKNIWKDPVNLKAPINSGGDDYGLVIEKYKPLNADDSILFAGYFTSTRPGGKGEDDIYRFEDRWLNIFTLKGKTLAKKYEKPEDPDSKLLGIEPLPGVKVELKNPTTDAVLATTISDKGGNYTFHLDKETDYKLTANKYDYFNKNETASTKGKRNQDSTYITIYKDIELEKIFKQKMIVIPNIYYDYDKADLRPESKAVLDSILVFFNDNKDLTIELGSHTDSRGSDAYNQKLSQARAQSAVDYLIEKGVAKDRLVAVGYGETKPVNKCVNGVECTEEEYQKNRRTTFRIIGSKQQIESVEPENIPVEGKPEGPAVPEK
jgi:outer membrane protein OmpA-like peptidoglycan-associated protein/tetratricopeptide (TPR) repeat protein